MFWHQIWFQVETFPGLHLSEEDKTVSRCTLQPIQWICWITIFIRPGLIKNSPFFAGEHPPTSLTQRTSPQIRRATEEKADEATHAFLGEGSGWSARGERRHGKHFFAANKSNAAATKEKIEKSNPSKIAIN